MYLLLMILFHVPILYPFHPICVPLSPHVYPSHPVCTPLTPCVPHVHSFFFPLATIHWSINGRYDSGSDRRLWTTPNSMWLLLHVLRLSNNLSFSFLSPPQDPMWACFFNFAGIVRKKTKFPKTSTNYFFE